MNVVAVLVSADANVNQAQTDDGATLYVASQEGHMNVVAALVSAGADVNQARDDGAEGRCMRPAPRATPSCWCSCVGQSKR